MENVITLLTTEDKDEIKKAIKEIIIEQVKNDFDSYDTYLFNPRQIESMIEEVVEEVKYEIRDTLKEKMIKEMETKLGL